MPSFLLTSHWSELSHMAVPSCKGGWNTFLQGYHVPSQNSITKEEVVDQIWGKQLTDSAIFVRTIHFSLSLFSLRKKKEQGQGTEEWFGKASPGRG